MYTTTCPTCGHLHQQEAILLEPDDFRAWHDCKAKRSIGLELCLLFGLVCGVAAYYIVRYTGFPFPGWKVEFAMAVCFVSGFLLTCYSDRRYRQDLEREKAVKTEILARYGREYKTVMPYLGNAGRWPAKYVLVEKGKGKGEAKQTVSKMRGRPMLGLLLLLVVAVLSVATANAQEAGLRWTLLSDLVRTRDSMCPNTTIETLCRLDYDRMILEMLGLDARSRLAITWKSQRRHRSAAWLRQHTEEETRRLMAHATAVEQEFRKHMQ